MVNLEKTRFRQAPINAELRTLEMSAALIYEAGLWRAGSAWKHILGGMSPGAAPRAFMLRAFSPGDGG